MAENLPPGKYIVKDEVICHENGEPVSLTEEQDRIIREQLVRAKYAEQARIYARLDKIFGVGHAVIDSE